MKKITPDIDKIKTPQNANSNNHTSGNPPTKPETWTDADGTVWHRNPMVNMGIPYKEDGVVLDAGIISPIRRDSAACNNEDVDCNNDGNNINAPTESARASELSKADISVKQERYESMETKKSAKPRKSRLGLALIALGVACVIAAVLFCISSAINGEREVTMQETSTYEVPDGLLVDGTIDSATNVVYLYDLSGDEAPYAVEYHAVADGAFGNDDLYEKWDGEESFDIASRKYKNNGNASNFREIEVHLPAEARGFVASENTQNANSVDNTGDAQNDGNAQDENKTTENNGVPNADDSKNNDNNNNK